MGKCIIYLLQITLYVVEVIKWRHGMYFLKKGSQCNMGSTATIHGTWFLCLEWGDSEVGVRGFPFFQPCMGSPSPHLRISPFRKWDLHNFNFMTVIFSLGYLWLHWLNSFILGLPRYNAPFISTDQNSGRTPLATVFACPLSYFHHDRFTLNNNF